jgi:NADPH2:quinone reductase
MKAIVYSTTGDSDVMAFVDRPVPEPAAGQVRVRVAMSGVTHPDWKARRYGHRGGKLMFP